MSKNSWQGSSAQGFFSSLPPLLPASSPPATAGTDCHRTPPLWALGSCVKPTRITGPLDFRLNRPHRPPPPVSGLIRAQIMERLLPLMAREQVKERTSSSVSHSRGSGKKRSLATAPKFLVLRENFLLIRRDLEHEEKLLKCAGYTQNSHPLCC